VINAFMNKIAQHKCNHGFMLPKLLNKYPHKAEYKCRKCGYVEVRTMNDKEVEAYTKSLWVNDLESLNGY